jgi:hypothetical protein
MITVERFGIVAYFDDSGFPKGELPRLYQPFLHGRFYEQPLLDYIRALNRRGVYVDVGACLGTHTIWFAMFCPATRVEAFEPRTRFAVHVRLNVEANHLGDRVAVHEFGLAGSVGTASAHLDGVLESFPVRVLDQLESRPVAILKIDVEGMEAAVLRGAARVLRRDHPVVFAESFGPSQRTEVRAALRPHGYVATGRVFGATPMYEYVWVPPKVRWLYDIRARAKPYVDAAWLRLRRTLQPLWRRLPRQVRSQLRSILRRGPHA